MGLAAGHFGREADADGGLEDADHRFGQFGGLAGQLAGERERDGVGHPGSLARLALAVTRPVRTMGRWWALELLGGPLVDVRRPVGWWGWPWAGRAFWRMPGRTRRLLPLTLPAGS